MPNSPTAQSGAKAAAPPPAPAGGGGLLAQALGLVDMVAAGAVIACLAALVLIVSAQVLLRYFFDSSLDWAFEASRLCFVAVMFLGMPLALKNHQHVGIDLLQARLPPHLRRWLIVALNVLGMALMAVVGVVGVAATRSTWDQTLSSIPISSGWFYVPVLWASLHMLARLVAQSLDLIRGGALPASTLEELAEGGLE